MLDIRDYSGGLSGCLSVNLIEAYGGSSVF